eukprot:TRINITY_DN39840_c0_g1_i3.p1 TRINITY_DN39840_c0_g1~~TRINITY_DN39840_c0_g1_i3.p1  ORF type:complete len:345 (+),score=49.90 TRINITY_DN39840_c0_g1_i3:72-1037(+)
MGAVAAAVLASWPAEATLDHGCTASSACSTSSSTRTHPPEQLLHGFDVAAAPDAFTEAEYIAFLRKLPITRSDWSNTNWLGEPRVQRLVGFLERFDWLLDHTDWAHRDPVTYREVYRRNLTTPNKRRRGDPRTVFATPYALQRMLSALERGKRQGALRPSGADRVLVLAGSDQLLSEAFGDSEQERQKTVSRLQVFFRAIFYMAKDVAIDGVRTMPIGLLEHYLRQPGVAERAAAAIAGASLTEDGKQRMALLPAGGHGDYSENVSVSVPDARYDAFEDRKTALRWALSKKGGEAGVEACLSVHVRDNLTCINIIIYTCSG